MFTKGIIVSIDRQNNTYMVRLPIFETAGNSTKWLVEATACVNPGTYEAYVKDDVVYVAFEDDSLSRPVIMGKLYLGSDNVYRSGQRISSLDVKDSAILPQKTQIGKITVEQLEKLFRLVSNLKEKRAILEATYPVGIVITSTKPLDMPKLVKTAYNVNTNWQETMISPTEYKYERLDD